MFDTSLIVRILEEGDAKDKAAKAAWYKQNFEVVEVLRKLWDDKAVSATMRMLTINNVLRAAALELFMRNMESTQEAAVIRKHLKGFNE